MRRVAVDDGPHIRTVLHDRQVQKHLAGPLAAVSVGVVEGEVLLDLCYKEDSRAQTDMNVAMTAAGGIVEIQATAEGAPFSRAESDQMLDAAAEGIRQLLKFQSDVLEGTS